MGRYVESKESGSILLRRRYNTRQDKSIGYTVNSLCQILPHSQPCADDEKDGAGFYCAMDVDDLTAIWWGEKDLSFFLFCFISIENKFAVRWTLTRRKGRCNILLYSNEEGGGWDIIDDGAVERCYYIRDSHRLLSWRTAKQSYRLKVIVPPRRPTSTDRATKKTKNPKKNPFFSFFPKYKHT